MKSIYYIIFGSNRQIYSEDNIVIVSKTLTTFDTGSVRHSGIELDQCFSQLANIKIPPAPQPPLTMEESLFHANYLNTSGLCLKKSWTLFYRPQFYLLNFVHFKTYMVNCEGLLPAIIIFTQFCLHLWPSVKASYIVLWQIYNSLFYADTNQQKINAKTL